MEEDIIMIKLYLSQLFGVYYITLFAALYFMQSYITNNI